MGQYYKIAFQHDGERVVVNGRKVEGEGYIPAKLMEHSWMGNPLTAVVRRLRREGRGARRNGRGGRVR